MFKTSIRASLAGLISLSAFSAHALTIDGPYEKIAQWTNPTPSVKWFGWSLSLTENEAAVLGTMRPVSVDARGMVSIYRYESDGLWHQDGAGLQDPETNISNEGCNRVAIDGDVVVIGAPGQPVGGHPGQGYVTVRIRTPTGWAPEIVLQQPDGAAYDNFGCNVAVRGNVLAVGTPYASSTGAVYIFTRSGDTWNFTAKVVPSDGAAGDMFGMSIAFGRESGLLAVGAPEKNALSGAAYVVSPSGTTWVEQAKIVSATGHSGDVFGSSVSLSGTSLAVGAPGVAGHTGVAYVFDRLGTTWAEKAMVAPDVPISLGGFGYSVSISGNTLAIGEPGNAAAHVYERASAGAWRRIASIGSSAAPFYPFGSVVAMNSSNLLIGAPSDGLSVDGTAYLFRSDVIFADGFQNR